MVADAVGVGFPVQAGERTVWQEARPRESGRVALVALGHDGPEELLPAEMSARTTVHEYGGLCWAVGGPGGATVVSVNHADQRLWLVAPGPLRPLTPEAPAPGACRYAAPVITPDGAWVVAVREVHEGAEVRNDLVAVPAAPSGPGHLRPPAVLAEGHDFYSWPAVSPDGRRLAFVTWDQPDMPWDATRLWVADFDGGRAGPARPLAETVPGSVLQPKWGVANSDRPPLTWVSDATGWWSLYCDGKALAPMEAEFARAAWAFGDSDYAPLKDGRLMATWRCAGRSHLGLVEGGRARALELPFTEFSQLSAYASPAQGAVVNGDVGLPHGEGVLAVAAGPAQPSQVVAIGASGEWTVLRASRPTLVGADSVSEAVHFSFTTADGERSHAIFYAPCLTGWEGEVGERPPLLVTSHGGPTDQASTAYQPRVQFWTTRGFAVVDVDYRGSTGYGRDYRMALEGRWGVADVEDCAGAASWLGEQGWADSGRTLLRGSSSSGLTVLAALARYPWIRGGVVRYPVCDLSQLAGAHKFESRYMERLVPADEMEARSPLNYAASVRAPVLFMHGADDRVVPCAATVDMVRAMRANGARPGLVVLEGEGHGFRQAANIVRSQLLELAFASDVLGLAPAGDMQGAWGDLRRAVSDEGAVWALPSAR